MMAPPQRGDLTAFKALLLSTEKYAKCITMSVNCNNSVLFGFQQIVEIKCVEATSLPGMHFSGIIIVTINLH